MAILGSAVIIAGMTQTTIAAADDTSPARSNETASVSEYMAYLAWKTASQEPGAADALSKFKALSPPDKEKYLDYLNNPKALEALLQEAAEGEPGTDTPTVSTAAANTTAAGVTSSTPLFGGDIVIETAQESTFTPDPDGPTPAREAQAAGGKLRKGTWESKFTASQKILGVTVTKLSVWVNYYTNGNKITKVNFADGGKRNYNAAVALTKSIPKAWMDGSYANGSIIWEGSIVFKDFGISIDKRQKVWANAYGFRGGYLKNA